MLEETTARTSRKWKPHSTFAGEMHLAEKNIRKIDKLSKEVKELSWEYKSLKADLMFKSKLTEVAKKVDTLGIKELTEPPKKIMMTSNEH